MVESYHSERSPTGLICQETWVRHPVRLLRSRRESAWVIFFSLIILALSCVLFFQVRNVLERFETPLIPDGPGRDTRITAIHQQMESLQGKFSVLLAESVEMKLKTLSKDIESGKVSAEDLRLFEELKSDLQLLEKYSANHAERRSLDSMLLEHPRFQQMAESRKLTPNPDWDIQVLRLKNLVYVCIAALVLTSLFLLGYWYRLRRLIRRISPSTETSPILIRRSLETGD
jgi:hypothetical protein